MAMVGDCRCECCIRCTSTACLARDDAAPVLKALWTSDLQVVTNTKYRGDGPVLDARLLGGRSANSDHAPRVAAAYTFFVPKTSLRLHAVGCK